jgi:hypothetical protein
VPWDLTVCQAASTTPSSRNEPRRDGGTPVVLDEFLDRGIVAESCEQIAQFLDARLVDATRGHFDGGGLQDASYPEEFQHGVVAMEIDDEAQRLQQQRWREAGDIRAIALSDIQDVNERQGADGLAQ